jgi:hypothetical protein
VNTVKVYDIVHVLFGFLASMLNQEWLLTLLYVFYQLMDFISDKNTKEIKMTL